MRLSGWADPRPLLKTACAIALFWTHVLSAAPSIGGVVNAATFKAGPVSPGALISVFGTAFAQGITQASAVPLPTTLAGVSVLVNDQPVPLFFVAASQINAQLPFTLAPGSARLTVRDAAGATASTTITVGTASPGIFSKTADGKGEAIATHANSSLIKRITGEYSTTGETIVLYCTGLGAVNGASVAGSPASSSPLPAAVQNVEVVMGGRPAKVTYAGLTPSSVGLYQVNLVVPGGIGGDVPTSVRIGSAISNEVMINVAGTFSLAANYSGVLQPRGTSEKWLLEFSSMTFTGTEGRFKGSYTLSRSGTVVDKGTFEVLTTSIFIVQGKSATGGPIYGFMDTLDAGQSFVGILVPDLGDAESWYAEFEILAKAPTPPPAPPITLPGGTLSACSAVEGAQIFAQDNKYLGKITSNKFDQDSIGNQFGSYGSAYSATSVFNQFGTYGSEFSAMSPFNQFASTPPIIYVNGRAQWYLTVNTAKTPRIAPTQLYPCIGK